MDLILLAPRGPEYFKTISCSLAGSSAQSLHVEQAGVWFGGAATIALRCVGMPCSGSSPCGSASASQLSREMESKISASVHVEVARQVSAMEKALQETYEQRLEASTLRHEARLISTRLGAEARFFVEECLAKGRPPLSTIDDTITCHRVIEATEASIADSRHVRVSGSRA